MAIDWSDKQTIARNLIDRAGASVTFNRVAGGTFDPVTGQATGDTTTAETVKIVSLPVSMGRKVFDKKTFENQSTTELRFFYAEVNANGFEPKNGDLVDFESKVWEVDGVTSIDPSGATPVLYMVGLKASARSVIP